jgi:peptide deformylase
MDNTPIKIYGEPVLRNKCSDVIFPSNDIKTVVLSMFLTMYKMAGVGLAANQVGLSERIAVINVDPAAREDEQVILINAEIIERSNEQEEAEEGCLSIPDVHGPVKRSSRIKVKNFDIDGAEYTFEADGLLAVAIQHELGHLNGEFFTDKMDGIHKTLIQNKLKKLARATKNMEKQ